MGRGLRLCLIPTWKRLAEGRCMGADWWKEKRPALKLVQLQAPPRSLNIRASFCSSDLRPQVEILHGASSMGLTPVHQPDSDPVLSVLTSEG